MAAPKEPHCDISKLQTKEDFIRIFQIVTNIANDVDLVRVRKSGAIYVCKYADCSKGQLYVDKVYNEYKLIRKTRLLIYCGLFYDKSTKSMLIIMESLKETLRSHVESKKDRKLKESQVKIIALDILQKLSILHENNYIHCDLKPENIMFRAKGSLTKQYENEIGSTWNIIDFGSIIYIDPNSSSSRSKYRGSIGWTPPEITMCNKQNKYNSFSYGSDIWSLGLIILFCTIGSNPYELNSDEIKNDDINNFNHFYNDKLMRYESVGCLTKKRKNYKLRCNGEEYLQNYLVNLFYNNKISQSLFDLLHDKMLTFDPKKRLNVDQLIKHKWFNQ